MVCIPCIVIPMVLWIFNKYFKPFLVKIWNPFGIFGKIEDKSTSKSPPDEKQKQEQNGVTKLPNGTSENGVTKLPNGTSENGGIKLRNGTPDGLLANGDIKVGGPNKKDD